MKSCNPYVFIVGVARSGTTLLQRMLDNHPLLAVSNDSHFIPWAISESVENDPQMTLELARRVASYRRFYRFELSEAKVIELSEGANSFSSFVSNLYDEYARMKNKRFAGEKTPSYVRHIPLLHQLFPKARFIHIVRDGRDVALSAMKWAVKDREPNDKGDTFRGPAKHPLWTTDPMGATALWWATQVEYGAEAGDILGPSLYRLVRYEDLIASPEEVLGQLALFLGLPDAPEMAAYHSGRESSRDISKSNKKAWMPATTGLRDWRSQMSRDDQVLFQELAGQLLRRFGYDVEVSKSDQSSRTKECLARWR